jgi:hypothetical protein
MQADTHLGLSLQQLLLSIIKILHGDVDDVIRINISGLLGIHDEIVFWFHQACQNVLMQNPNNDGPCVDQHEDLGDLLNSSAESKSARVVCLGVPVNLTCN